MAIKPDWTQGRLTLFAGSNQFTTTGSALRTIGVQAGDALLTQSGAVLVIDEITDENSGSLYEPCPAMAAGFDQPLRVRFQADGSRLSAATRELMALLSSGNAYAFSQLLGDVGKIPYFTAPGVMGLLDLASLSGGGGASNWNALVATLAGRDAFDGEDVGFRVLVADNGNGQAVVYEKTATGWSVPVPFTGSKGSDGPPNALTVGTVSEGTQAHVSITGTAPNQFVNFVLQRGEKGTDGERGADGDVTPAALAAKDAAEKWAANPIDVEVESGKFSALHYSLKAKGENEEAAASAAIVRDNKPNIDAVAANKANIDSVAGNETNINAVKNNETNINAVAANGTDIDAVAANIAAVLNVSGISDDVTAVSSVKANVSTVAGIAPQVFVVADIEDEIIAVTGNKTNINAVAGNEANIVIVANNSVNVSLVATNIADVVIAADNMPAIIAAPENAQSAVNARNKSHDWATAPEDTPVDDGENQGFSALHYSKKAQAIAGGGVTSVGMSVPVSLSLAGSPITTSGTFIIAHADGYQGYTTAEALRLAGIEAGAQVNPNMALYQTVAQKDAAHGYAGLDANGKLSENQLPAIAITDTFVVATQAAMLALNVQRGDICVRSDLNKTFALQAEPATTLANWIELRTPTDAVLSVVGLGGAISQADLRNALGLGTAAYEPSDTFATTALATASVNGLMSAADKAKLSNIPEGATTNTGTVTSVAMSVPTGFSVSGAITTSGTFAMMFAAGYQGFTTVQSDKLATIAEGAQVNPNMSLYQARSERDAAGGYAGLDGSGKLSAAQLPSIAITDTFVVATQAAMLALPVQVGDIAVRTDVNKTFIVQAEPATTLANWVELRTPTDAVQSVIGLTGPITQAELRTALGLGTAAYAAAGDFATAASGVLANTAVQPAVMVAADDLRVPIAGAAGLGGFTADGDNLASMTGSLTPTVNPSSNFKYGNKTGALTLTAPANGFYEISILVTNTVGTGAFAAIGFDFTSGNFNIENGKVHTLDIRIRGAYKILFITGVSA